MKKVNLDRSPGIFGTPLISVLILRRLTESGSIDLSIEVSVTIHALGRFIGRNDGIMDKNVDQCG